MRLRVLLIEGDEAAAEPLVNGLTVFGHHVAWERTGADGLARATGDVDIVLLGRKLRDIDALDVLRELRDASDVPLIMIGACPDGRDRVTGLELGADDSVDAAMDVYELHARMRAVLRRARGAGPGPRERHGRLSLDRRAHRVFLDGAEVALTPREYALLAFLTRQPGALVRREEIMREVWDSHWFGPTKTLDAHIAALRRKLGEALVIQTVRGVGFRLEVKPADS